MPCACTRYRVSIYGRKPSEWDKLARWVWVHRLASPNVRWLIQVPRLYEVYKKTGQIDSFQDMLDNLFLPLFKVSVDPSSNPMLHHFLRQVVGFDCVDDESKHEQSADPSEPMPPPAEWTQPHSPPYFYWVYYLSANLMSLNQLRSSKGLSTFSFRPHSGEAGDVAHVRGGRWRVGVAATACVCGQAPSVVLTNPCWLELRAPAGGDVPDGREHQPRHHDAQVTGAPVPVLPHADRFGHVPPQQQQTLRRVRCPPALWLGCLHALTHGAPVSSMQLPPQPVPHVLCVWAQRVAVDRRSADPALHAGAACGRVLRRGAGVEAQLHRHV